jgi:hypothetical protein
MMSAKVIRDRVEPAASPAMSAMPQKATKFRSPVKCRDVPGTDIAPVVVFTRVVLECVLELS